MRREKKKMWLGVAAALLLAGCVAYDPQEDIMTGVTGGALSDGPSSEMELSYDGAVADLPPYSKGRLSTRSLIDSETTVAVKANFLRIDEDLTAEDRGLYTFTSEANPASSPYYRSVNWYDSYLLEATLMSSPDKDMIRSVFLDPVQTYKMRIHTDENDVTDTLDFYHTRMVGWYPMTCGDGQGSAPVCKVGEMYSSVVSEGTDASGRGVVSVQFHNLDGQTDVMVSDMLEGQHWHSPDADSGVSHYHSNYAPAGHPTLAEGTKIYASPFGHHSQERVMGPNGETLQWAIDYDNHFTYKHYLSAVRVYAHADQSPQSLSMWGQIENVVFANQPTSVKVSLPYELGGFGEAYDWDNYANYDIATGRLFGEGDTNSDDAVAVTYPISMKDAEHDTYIYLGYALVRPDHDVELQLHTSSGVYLVTIPHQITDDGGNTVDVFKSSNIYDIMLDLKTNGSIAALLEKEEDYRYYDLTRLTLFENPDESDDDFALYRYANTYIVSPDHTPKIDEDGRFVFDAYGNPVYDTYDGYCFSANTIGNGQAGIISHGTQTLYPADASISPVSARLLWESQLGLVTQVELIYGYVRFRVPDRAARGNAVIAVYDENGKVLWSWHIWITDPPQERVFENGENDIILLDRNLGATKEVWTGAGDALDTYGLYYQWGRKDPSMGPNSYNYSITDLITAPYWDYSSRERTAAEVTQFARPTIRDGVENPMFLILPTAQQQAYYFNWIYERNDILWGYYPEDGAIFKTIYDPCPFGYRVPLHSEMSTVFRDAATRENYGQIVKSSGGDQIYFPYAGYKGVDRELQSLVLSWNSVGDKGDYMTATISKNNTETFAGQPTLDHRGRIYIVSDADDDWEETQDAGAYHYTTADTEGKHRVLDYANRRTAASVRCVKNFSVGSIGARLTASQDWYIPGTEIKLYCEAVSSENQISSAILTVESVDTGLTKTLYKTLPDQIESNQPMWGREESFIIGVMGGEFWSESYIFTLTVYNSFGVKDEVTQTIYYHDHPLSIDLSLWEAADAAEAPLYNHEEYTRRFVVNTESQADVPANVTVQYHNVRAIVTVEPDLLSSVGTAHTYEFKYRMTDFGDKAFTITAVCREQAVHTATQTHYSHHNEKILEELQYYFRPVNSRWFYWGGEEVVFDWWVSSPNGNISQVGIVYDYDTDWAHPGSDYNAAGSTIWSQTYNTPSVGSSGAPQQYTFDKDFIQNDRDGRLQAAMQFTDEYGKTAEQRHQCYIMYAEYEGWSERKRPDENFTLAIYLSGGAEPTGTGVNAVINGSTVSFTKDTSYTGSSNRLFDTRWTATLSLPEGTYDNTPLTLTFWDGTLTTTAPSISVANARPLTISITASSTTELFYGDKVQGSLVADLTSGDKDSVTNVKVYANGVQIYTANSWVDGDLDNLLELEGFKGGNNVTYRIDATNASGTASAETTVTTVYKVTKQTASFNLASVQGKSLLFENQNYPNTYLADGGRNIVAQGTISSAALMVATASRNNTTYPFAFCAEAGEGDYIAGTSNTPTCNSKQNNRGAYAISYYNGGHYIRSTSNNYWKQTSNTAITMSSGFNGNYLWNVYVVTAE